MKKVFFLILISVVCDLRAQDRVTDSIKEVIRNTSDKTEALVEKAGLVLRYYNIGDVSAALSTIRECELEALKLGSDKATAAVLNTKGVMFYYDSRFDSALHYFNMELPLMRKANDKK